MPITIEITTDIEPWIDGVHRTRGDVVTTEDQAAAELLLERGWATEKRPAPQPKVPFKTKRKPRK